MRAATLLAGMRSAHVAEVEEMRAELRAAWRAELQATARERDRFRVDAERLEHETAALRDQLLQAQADLLRHQPTWAST